MKILSIFYETKWEKGNPLKLGYPFSKNILK